MENKAYDERCYLDESNIYEREFLLNEQRFWSIREVYDGILYSSLIKDYESFIKVASKLIDEITPNKDELSKINTIMYLIKNGVFSYNGKFKDMIPSVDIISSKTGLNILEGGGCCRHVAGFINDIMPLSTLLTCVGEVYNPYYNEANHVINKINYDGNIYGFDAFNEGILFDFVSDVAMLSIDEDVFEKLYYKPYAEIVFYKRSFEEVKCFLEQVKKNGDKKITAKKAKEIALTAALNVYCNTDLISDFRSDTRVQLDSINEQIKEIRIKQ